MFQVWFKGTSFDFENEEGAIESYNRLVSQYPNNFIRLSEEIDFEIISILKEVNAPKSYPNPYRTNRILLGVPRI